MADTGVYNFPVANASQIAQISTILLGTGTILPIIINARLASFHLQVGNMGILPQDFNPTTNNRSWYEVL